MDAAYGWSQVEIDCNKTAGCHESQIHLGTNNKQDGSVSLEGKMRAIAGYEDKEGGMAMVESQEQ